MLIFHIEKKDFEDLSAVVHIAYLLSLMNSWLLEVVTPMAQVRNCPEISLSWMCTISSWLLVLSLLITLSAWDLE